MGEIKCPHCDTSVDEHEAGRCLDAWVAEAVMGCKPADRQASPDGIVSLTESDDRIIYLPDWSPSAKIAAAWEVVGRFFRFDVGTDGMLYLCEVGISPTRKFIASADTAPLAICRAALKGSEE